MTSLYQEGLYLLLSSEILPHTFEKILRASQLSSFQLKELDFRLVSYVIEHWNLFGEWQKFLDSEFFQKFRLILEDSMNTDENQ